MDRIARAASLSGPVFLLASAGALVAAAPPPDGASWDVVATFLVEEREALAVRAALRTIALAALVVFAAVVARAMRKPSGPSTVAAGVASTAGAAGAAVLFVAHAASVAAARAPERGQVLWDLAQAGAPLAHVPLAIACAAAACAAFVDEALPTALGALAVVAALLLLSSAFALPDATWLGVDGPIAQAAMPAYALWVAATGAWMRAKRFRPRAPAR